MRIESGKAHLFRTIELRLIKALNVLLVCLPFTGCWLGYYAFHIAVHFSMKVKLLVPALFVIVYFGFGRAYEAFLVSYRRIGEMFFSQLLALLLSDLCLFIVLWAMMPYFPSPLPAMAALAAQTALSFLWCTFSHAWYFRRFPPRRTAIVYDTQERMESLINAYGMDKKFNIVKTLSARACMDDYSSLDGLEAVFLSGVHSHDRNSIIKQCVEKGVTAFVLPRLGDLIMSGARRVHMFHLPMFRVDRFNPCPGFLAVKRATDILVSGAALLLLSPAMLIIALLIIKDGGPVLYRQKRLTKNGKVFTLYKFRSMSVHAEDDGVARLSTVRDDRVTGIGRVLRARHLDELPQLINILRGDMSLVGPRPERPEIALQYEKDLPEFHLRLQTKAGLTGYAQVYGKYNSTPYDKLSMDLMYIANASIQQDLQILLATLSILFSAENTQGVDENKTTAL